MKQSRLLQYLEKFSARERKRFHAYVVSPFFNKNQKVQQLCEILLQQAPTWSEARLDRQRLYAAIYPGESFHAGRFNNLVSDLLHLLYDFMAQCEYQSHKQVQKHLLLERLLTSEWPKDIERIARSHHQLQQQEHHRHIDYYMDEYQLYEKLDRHFFSKGIRAYDENLQLKNDMLDRYYLISKFRIACDMASRNIVIGSAYDCRMLDELLRHYELEKDQWSGLAVLEIYYQILQMLTLEEGESAYRQAKVLITQSHHLFPQEDLREAYIFILNYCIRQINIGKSRFFKEILDLYKAMLQSKVVFKNGYMPQWTFKNISTAGIRLKEFEWTEQFILKYEQQLLPEERQNAIAYNLAALYYAQKEYAKALSQLHDVEFVHASYHLGAKIIQLKSYYELDEEEAFFALIEASKKYVGRNRQLSDYGKNANLNFLRIIRRLFLLKSSRSRLKSADYKKKARLLAERLDALHPLANKDWLEEAFGQIQ